MRCSTVTSTPTPSLSHRGAELHSRSLMHDMRAQHGQSQADRAIGTIAERQHGVISRAQLAELGLGRGAIRHRMDVGRLRVVHRGVYTIGHRLLSTDGRWMAAVLACGPGAVLSHRSAAALWGIRQSSRIEVTAPATRHPRSGIVTHRSPLRDDERTTHRGIPVTTVPRTLLDLGAAVRLDELRGAFRQAEQLRLTDPLSLHDLAERYPRRPGVAAARAVLEEARLGLGIVRSELEERFQAFLLRAGLPLPRTNVFIGGYEIDCAWPERRLIVELDGHATHAPSHAFERDRARDRRLGAAGWRVIRITWRQLLEEPHLVDVDLRRLLGQPVSRTV
jgi:very-short-patch-repair endonuclease/predicted transcriptional regulator of viral defense system